MRLVQTPVSILFAAATLAAAQSHPAPPVSAQLAAVAPPSARIVYTFDRPQLQPPHYTITIDESGLGRFVSLAGSPPANDTDDVYPAPIDRQIRLDPVLLAALFGYARNHHDFNEDCRRRGHLAFTGNKTMTYIGPDGRGSCAFVWAADPALQRISDQLAAVAYTLEIGRRLNVEMRHDPLGLDSELAALQEAVARHSAGDLPNIAPEIQSIAAGQDFMNRVRRRALSLLTHCQDCLKSDERSAANLPSSALRQ